MEKIKILLADDEQDVLAIMARKIAAAGFDVVTACDGAIAWEKIKTESPDVLVDLRPLERPPPLVERGHDIGARRVGRGRGRALATGLAARGGT